MNDFELAYQKIIKEIHGSLAMTKLKSLKEVTKPIIMYGLGEQAVLLFELCKKYQIKIAGFADTRKTGKFADSGCQIMSMMEMVDKYPDGVILISTWKYTKAIAQSLESVGYLKDNIIDFPFSHPYLINQENFGKFYLEGYERAYYFFEDDRSREIILNRIRAYLYDNLMVQTSEAPKYFEFPFLKHEVFVQAGTYCGETVQEFIDLCDNKHSYEIHTFEADPQAYGISMERLSKLESVYLVNKGLWSEDAILKFSTDELSGSASFVMGSNQELSIAVTSLDNYFSELEAKPTFIQLDIEGAEAEALRGAEHIIRTYKPKLAICVYHKYEDVYEIPELIRQMNPNYRFWLQHCETGIYDTVLYAE